MRKLLRNLCIFAAVAGSPVLAKEPEKKTTEKKPAVRTVDGEMLVKWNGIYFYDLEKKPFTGHAISKFPNGKTSYDAELTAGKTHGRVTTFHENGTKQFETQYRNGVKHGLETNWYSNGTRQLQVNYKDGKRHGKMTSWQGNGLKDMEIFFVEGLLDGPLNLFDENEQILSKRIYKKGRLASPRPTKKPSSKGAPTDILGQKLYIPDNHNNPGFPVWDETEDQFVLTPLKRKGVSGWIWLQDEITPPFELTLEYLAKPRANKGKTTHHSGMSILFCKTPQAHGVPEIEGRPGFLADESGYALLFPTSGKNAGFRLLNAKGETLQKSTKENTKSGGKWKKVALRVQKEGIHVYFNDQTVFSQTNPNLEDMQGGLAIVAANGKVPCTHNIRKLSIKNWRDPDVADNNPPPPPVPPKPQVYTVGYAHLENKDGIRYETGTNKPFSGKAIDFYANGQKKLEYHFKDGRQHGVCSFWYPNGQRAVRIDYFEGISVEEKKWTKDGETIQ